MIRVIDVRWQCPQCGRFLAPDTIGEQDHVDPGAYYGIRTEIWADCPKCGRVENPRLKPVGTLNIQEATQ